jgi:hypothetical protein
MLFLGWFFDESDPQRWRWWGRAAARGASWSFLSRGTMSLTGQQCMGSTLLPFLFTLSNPTATSVTLQWLNGQPLTLVKTGATVTMTNGGASQSFTCTSGDCARSAGGAVCFHESTLITYRGTVRTLRDFTQGHDSEDCHVPHTKVSALKRSALPAVKTRCCA